jgi:hypothetical protein
MRKDGRERRKTRKPMPDAKRGLIRIKDVGQVTFADEARGGRNHKVHCYPGTDGASSGWECTEATVMGGC